MRTLKPSLSVVCALLGAPLLLLSPAAKAADSSALLTERCASCHLPGANGGLSRIAEVRKSPEAWDMTLVRMVNLHGVSLSGAERRSLVKHLSDHYGLAPSETEGYRYVLERTPGVTDSGPDDDMTQMCARCHTYARVALQRRTEADWLKLIHFHLA